MEANATPRRSLSSSLSKSFGRPSSSAYDQFDEQSWLTDLTSGIRNALQTSPPASSRSRDRRRQDELLAGDEGTPSKLQELNEWARQSQLKKKAPTDAEILDVRTAEDDPSRGIARLLELDAKDEADPDSVEALDLNSAAQELIALGGLVEDAGDQPLQLSDLIKKASGEPERSLGAEEEEEAVETPAMHQPRSNGFVPASSLFKPGASIEDVLRSRMEQAAEAAIEDEEEGEQSGDASEDDEELEEPEDLPAQRPKPSLIQVIGDNDDASDASDSQASDDEESEVEYAEDQEEPIGTDDGDEDDDAEDDEEDEEDEEEEEDETEQLPPAIAKSWHQQAPQGKAKQADDDVIEIMSSSEEEDEVEDQDLEDGDDYEGEEDDQEYDEEDDGSNSFSTYQEMQAQENEDDLLLGAEDEDEYDEEVESQEDFDLEAAQSFNPQQTQQIPANEPQDFVQPSHSPNGFANQRVDAQPPFPIDFTGQGYFSDYLSEPAAPTPYNSVQVPGFLQRDASATHFGPLPANAPLESPAVQPAYDPQLFAQIAQQAFATAPGAPVRHQAESSTSQPQAEELSAVEPLPTPEPLPSASAAPEPSGAPSEPISLDTTIAIREATGALEGPGTSAGSVVAGSAIGRSEAVQQEATVAANPTSAEDLIDFKAHAESIAQDLVGEAGLSGPPSLSASDGGSVRKHPATTEATAELRLEFDRPTLSSQAIERRLGPPLIDTPPGTPSGSLQPRNGMGLTLLKSRAAQLVKEAEASGSEVATAGDEDVTARDQSMVEGAVEEAEQPQDLPMETESRPIGEHSAASQAEVEPTLPGSSDLVASNADDSKNEDESRAALQETTSEPTAAVADQQAPEIEDSAMEEDSAVVPEVILQADDGDGSSEPGAAVILDESEPAELPAKDSTDASEAPETQLQTSISDEPAVEQVQSPAAAEDEAIEEVLPSASADAAHEVVEPSAADLEEEDELVEQAEPSAQDDVDEIVQEGTPSTAEDQPVEAAGASAADEDEQEEALPTPDSAPEKGIVIEEEAGSEHSGSDDSVQLVKEDVNDSVDVSVPAIEDMQSALDEAWPEEVASGPVETSLLPPRTQDSSDPLSAQQAMEALAKAIVEQEAPVEEATRLPFSEDDGRAKSPSESSEPLEEPVAGAETAPSLEAREPSLVRDESPVRSTAFAAREPDAMPSSESSQVEVEQPLANRSLRSLRKELREHHRAQGEQSNPSSPSKADQFDSEDAVPPSEEAEAVDIEEAVPPEVKSSPAKERQTSPVTPRKRQPRKSGDPDQRDWLPEEHPERPSSTRKRGHAESEAPVKRQKKHSSKEEHPGLDADLSLEVLEDEVQSEEPALATIEETEVTAPPEPAVHTPHTRSQPKRPSPSPQATDSSNAASDLKAGLFDSTPRRLSTSSAHKSYGKRPNRALRAASQTVGDTSPELQAGPEVQEQEAGDDEDVEMEEASTPRRITRAQSQASSEMDDDGPLLSSKKTRAGSNTSSSSATRKRKGGAKARGSSPTTAEIIVGTSGSSTGRVTRAKAKQMEE